MNLLRSFLNCHSLLSPSRTITTTPLLLGEKIPAKKLAIKKAAAAAAAATPAGTPATAAAAAAVAALPTPIVAPDNPHGHNPRNPKAKHYHPHPMPKVDWWHDKTMPKDSVMSYQPIPSHRWQNWMMLRDVKRRAYVERDGRERKLLNLLLRSDKIIPKELGEEAERDVRKLTRDSNYIRIHSRCMFTSKPRGLARGYQLSRIVWRDHADHNLWSGVQRAVWGNMWNDNYYEHIKPDLTGTLKAIDPVEGKPGADYHFWENRYTGKPVPSPKYNHNVFKSGPFVYPKGPEVPKVYRKYRHDLNSSARRCVFDGSDGLGTKGIVWYTPRQRWKQLISSRRRKRTALRLATERAAKGG